MGILRMQFLYGSTLQDTNARCLMLLNATQCYSSLLKATRHYLKLLDSAWQYLKLLDATWRYLTLLDTTWNYVLDSTRQYLTLLDATRRYSTLFVVTFADWHQNYLTLLSYSSQMMQIDANLTKSGYFELQISTLNLNFAAIIFWCC